MGAAAGATADAAAKPRQIEFEIRKDYFGRSRRYFPAREIALHNSETDCWLVAHRTVYDVTTFLKQHPAGDTAILRHGGTDSTMDFDFHSPKAQKMWARYMIGYVAEGETCVIC